VDSRDGFGGGGGDWAKLHAALWASPPPSATRVHRATALDAATTVARIPSGIRHPATGAMAAPLLRRSDGSTGCCDEGDGSALHSGDASSSSPRRCDVGAVVGAPTGSSAAAQDLDDAEGGSRVRGDYVSCGY